MAPITDGGGPGPEPGILDLESEINALKKQLGGAFDDIKKLFASKQVNGTSAQVVGNGTAQVFSPSFTAIAGGLTGLKVDDTGVSLFGRQIWASPWTRDNELIAIKAQFPQLRISVAALKRVTVTTGDRITALRGELKLLVAEMDKAGASHRNMIGQRGRTSNAAELDALKLAIAQVAERLG
jgi:hypothetical protein